MTGSFLSPKILKYAQNSQWAQNVIFTNGIHIFFQFVDKLLKVEEMEYLVHLYVEFKG